MQENSQRNNNISSDNLSGEKVFYAKKYFYGAFTWIVCTLLLIPTYIDTKILPILLLVPFTIIMSISYIQESKRLYLKIKGNEISYVTRHGFVFKERIIRFMDIKKIKLDVSIENKEEVIDAVELVTKDNIIELPDIDDKDSLISNIKKMKLNIPIDRNN